MARTIEERMADIEARENRLKQQKKKLRAEASKKERNARTKRLIEVGAIVEKALEMSLDTPEKKEALLHLLIDKRTNKQGQSTSYAAYFRDYIEKQSNMAH